MSDSRRTVFLSGAAVMLASILLLAGFSIFNRYLYTPKHPAPGKKILSLKNHPEKPADDSDNVASVATILHWLHSAYKNLFIAIR